MEKKILTFKQLFPLLENVHPNKRTPKSLAPFFEAMDNEETLNSPDFDGTTIEIDEKATAYILKMIKPDSLEGEANRALLNLEICAMEVNRVKDEIKVLMALGLDVPKFNFLDFEKFWAAKSFNELALVKETPLYRIEAD